MLRRWMVLVLVASVVIGGGWLTHALSQPRGRERGTPEERKKRMDDFRKRMGQEMQKGLGASDAEWKVLQPRIEKVQQLQRQSRGGFGGRFGGRRGRRPGGDRRPEGAPQREQSEIEKKTAALRSLLDDKASGAQAIKAALGALRQVRQKAEQELAVARGELKKVLTVRQEAYCVLRGILQ